MSLTERLVRLWDFIAVMLKTGIAYVFGRLIYRNKGLWLIGERIWQAQDNGYHFFKYMNEKHPERRVCYVIRKDSSQLSKVAGIGEVIYQGTWKHWLMYYGCEALISTHIRSLLPSNNWRYSKMAARHKQKNKKIVFLQHGVTKDNIPGLYRERAHADLFICGAEPEYYYVRNNFQYHDNEVKYTGFARFDALHDFTVKKQILIMPTWRLWLSEPGCDIASSEYIQEWNKVITDKRMIDAAKQAGYRIMVYPHSELQPMCHLFRSVDDCVIITREAEYDIQTLLKESALLITDYSSVFFDFAYMRKPVLYFQFDKERFVRDHYQDGYFDYETDGFGKISYTAAETVENTAEVFHNDFVLSEKYRKRIDRFFPLYDRNNCDRIYDEIVKLVKKDRIS